ncbi:hypothetical protein FRUB_04439 [Fimbriiglobus ruber]|uniref:Uncharacterized protein n=2 Tax=Fimbriiglobus ruber TaxID=1908690 RepID=A0A225DLR4_9BACT|nr:hypothetical protein FRUB_04439 [Fimbriiglobus ruber]
MPAHDRVWDADDMERAGNVLSRLCEERGYYLLPKYDSERSAMIFKRITDPENTACFTDDSLSFEKRFQNLRKFLNGRVKISRLYESALKTKDTHKIEYVEDMGSEMRFLPQLFDLLEDFMDSLNENDPAMRSWCKRQKEMENYAIKELVVHLIDELAEPEQFHKAEFQRLVGYMHETMPKYFKRLPKEHREFLIGRLERLQKSPNTKMLQPGLDELMAKVKGPVRKPAPK